MSLLIWLKYKLKLINEDFRFNEIQLDLLVDWKYNI